MPDTKFNFVLCFVIAVCLPTIDTNDRLTVVVEVRVSSINGNIYTLWFPNEKILLGKLNGNIDKSLSEMLLVFKTMKLKNPFLSNLLLFSSFRLFEHDKV